MRITAPSSLCLICNTGIVLAVFTTSLLTASALQQRISKYAFD